MRRRRLQHQQGCPYWRSDNQRWDPEAEEEVTTGDVGGSGGFVVCINGVPIWIMRGPGDFFIIIFFLIVLPLCMTYGLYNLACLRRRME